ncbi:DUF2961 domain-containing protein [Streptomyces luomodiensis]|uniref:DUF2961 domain-containing protein n=1 Tax=Streptomyces luomodiensis TaxID=3026192 RepID=A0ABY9V7W1_9ACTN|nr:glycoside hydrolase family 172 protein [Streptomyces sp. SCA4-21]WNF00692.1 DUF2961 domain-containing protein [Streptomyces sp. SCA4-21]
MQTQPYPFPLTPAPGMSSRAITAENPSGQKGAGGRAASALGPGRKGRPCVDLPSGETTVIADIPGAGVITHIWITCPAHTDAVGFVLRDLVVRAYWDGDDQPAVEAPLGDFFCNGNGARALLTSQPVTVAPTGGMNAYFQMPFADGARITVTNEHPADITGFFFQIDYVSVPELPEHTPRFHAQWRRQRTTVPGRDYVVLDGVTGAGRYLGTFLSIVALERYWWGEGEMKFFIDGDTDFPTICGTGTEDYAGGAWAFQNKLSATEEPDVLTFSAPYFGYPQYETRDVSQGAPYATAMAPHHGLYRWHLADPVYFAQDLKVTLQQIGQVGTGLFERSDDVSSVAYWYQHGGAVAAPAFPSRAERTPR